MTIRKSLAIALLSGIGAFSMMQPSLPATVVQYAQPSRRLLKRMRQQGSVWSYPAHDGHSVAHGKRMAKKARNVKRHKRACKGK